MTLPSIAILAGGLATRLRPVTDTIPKAMVMVAGEPFAFHQLRLLASQGFRKAVFLVGYKGEQIVEAIGDGSQFGIAVDYVFDGPVLLGTGGAVSQALEKLSDPFAVIYGDSWLEFDYGAAVSQFEASKLSALMTVFRNNPEWDKSNVEFQGGQILRYSKTKTSAAMTHIDYGFSIFRKSVFEQLHRGEPMDLSTIQETLAEQGQLAAFEAKNRYFEVGSFAGCADLEDHFRSKGIS